MPEINKIPVPTYQPLFPYHWSFDNLPIEGLITRVNLVNFQVDNNADILRDSVGSQGTLSNRLNQSIEENGDLKTKAIDDATHSIESHTDTDEYVRMLSDERDKLTVIDPSATNLSIDVETISTTLQWPELANVLSIGPSPTITWRMSNSELVADTVVPISLQHIHVYDIDPITTDNINFKTTTVNTSYQAGTLRVFVNGLRLTETTDEIGGFYFSEDDPSVGTFFLNAILSGTDIIRIDFNQPIT